MKRPFATLACTAILALGGIPPALAQSPSPDMSFFVSSAGPGKGADLGGLDGADKLCQSLATAAGAGGKTWRAYLSTQGPNAVNAKDRIGKGPWKNAKGVVVARTVEELHMGNNINHETALSEKGQINTGRIDSPPGTNQHDILTGTQADGTAFPPGKDMTCSNWTSSGDGNAMLGHSDRMGLDYSLGAHSWNSSHPSAGCSEPALAKTGGAGKIYCFAAN